MPEHLAYWMAVSVNLVFVIKNPLSTGHVPLSFGSHCQMSSKRAFT